MARPTCSSALPSAPATVRGSAPPGNPGGTVTIIASRAPLPRARDIADADVGKRRTGRVEAFADDDEAAAGGGGGGCDGDYTEHLERGRRSDVLKCRVQGAGCWVPGAACGVLGARVRVRVVPECGVRVQSQCNEGLEGHTHTWCYDLPDGPPNEMIPMDFFIERITAQAAVEGVRLSDVECRLLSWVDKPPYSAADDELHTAFLAESPYEDFDSKVTGLVQRAFRSDFAAGAQAAERYRQAYEQVAASDYYLRHVLVDEIEALVAPAVSGRVGRYLAMAGLTPLLLVPAAILALLGCGFAWGALQREFEGFALIPAALFTAVCFCASVFLVRLWRREWRARSTVASTRSNV